MRKPEVWTFCVKGFPGSNRALINLAKNTGLTKHFVLSGNHKESLEIKFFTDYVQEESPSVVIWGGWSTIYESMLSHLGERGTNLGVFWTSSPGQVDISQEIEQLSFLLRDSRLRYKLFANQNLASLLKSHLDNVHYLPDTLLLPVSSPRKARAQNIERRVPIISLFCSPFEYKRKNILNCLLALSTLHHDYLLYLNGLSENAHYKAILAALNVPYRDFGWLDERRYHRLLGTIDIGLQVSFAETFNHVVADHVLRGIPVVTSRMVPIMSNMPVEVKRRLVADNPEDPMEIKDKIEYLILNPEVRRELGAMAFDSLTKENRERIKTAVELVKQLTQNC
jgi:hypothetical protein